MTGPQVLAISEEQARQDLVRHFELFGEPSDLTIVAAALRRLCGFMCPCPPSAVKQVAQRSLQVLGIETEVLKALIEVALEDMTVCGDLLQLAHMAISGGQHHPNWIYCAPPSYVRRGGRVHIFGIAADDASFLPGDLRAQMRHDGAMRFLELEAEANVATQLSRLGLREISSDVWMTNTPREQAKQVVERYARRLEITGVLGDLPETSVLLPRSGQRVGYRNRWTPAAGQTGRLIARVPQPYGEPLWYFCSLDAGVVQRSLLLPLKESTERASDAAWRLQLAMDAAAGNPATYSVRADEDGAGVLLSFDFPLPLAARRRLLVLGARRNEQNPYQFWLPAAEMATEARFLREHYWLEQNKEVAP
jgi:hypothetical protein